MSVGDDFKTHVLVRRKTHKYLINEVIINCEKGDIYKYIQ